MTIHKKREKKTISLLGEERSVVLEVGTGVLGDKPLLLWKTDLLTGLVDVLHTSLTVGGGCALYRVDPLADNGLAHDQLRLAVIVGLCGLEGLYHSSQTVGEGIEECSICHTSR